MVSVKSLAMLAALLVVIACGTSSHGSATPTGTGSPAPTANPADSKAVDLRVRFGLLLGEQVMIVAKQAAAAAGHNDEYTGYATLLTANGNDLTALIASAFGNQAATQFKQAWDLQNGYLAAYTIGVVTHDAGKSSTALSGLQNGFVRQFAQVMARLTQVTVDGITPAVTQRTDAIKTVLDDELAQSYSTVYPDLHRAYADPLIGDMFTKRIVDLFPDKFPGDPGSSAADLRVSLNSLLQEHAFLATMATDAAAEGRTTEQAAAVTALGGNAVALGKVFSTLLGPAAGVQFKQVWGDRDADLISYATAGAAATRLNLTDKFVTGFSLLAPSAAGAAHDQMLATLKVVDDQRAKSYGQIAPDDHASASAMQPIADRID